jgi:diadenosine tetraphosphate (Ap4A) HIT family hydrolase
MNNSEASQAETTQVTDSECRFCVTKPSRRLIAESEYGFAAWDRQPASEGHFLVIPYRHFASYFDINDEELVDLWKLVARGKEACDEKYKPDGYNIGINVGTAAGQSIHHLHIHVIPRYTGDVENPRGGVRGVIPDKKLYTFKPD